MTKENVNEVDGPCLNKTHNCTCFDMTSSGMVNDSCGCLPGYEAVMLDGGNRVCRGNIANVVLKSVV